MSKTSRRDLLMLVMCGLIFCTASTTLYFAIQNTRNQKKAKAAEGLAADLDSNKSSLDELRTKYDTLVSRNRGLRSSHKSEIDELTNKLNSVKELVGASDKVIRDSNAVQQIQMSRLNQQIAGLNRQVESANLFASELRRVLNCEDDAEVLTKIRQIPGIDEKKVASNTNGDPNSDTNNDTKSESNSETKEAVKRTAKDIGSESEKITKLRKQLAELNVKVKRRDSLLMDQRELIDRLKIKNARESSKRITSQKPTTNLAPIRKSEFESGAIQPTQANPVKQIVSKPAIGNSTTENSTSANSSLPVIKVIETLDENRVISRRVMRGGMEADASAIPSHTHVGHR